MIRLFGGVVAVVAVMCTLGIYVTEQQPATPGGVATEGGDAATSCGLKGGPDLSKQQQSHAITIIEVAESKKLPERAAVIAIATAMQESTLHNYGDLGAANDHDSLGLFQQRPSSGWGSPDELTDPEYAAGAFFDALAEVDGWESMPLSQAAQAVQNSAFPGAYAKHEDTAQAIVDSVDCQARWIKPVEHGVVSEFRPAARPDHDGTDLGSPRGTPIKAAAAGTVTASACQATIGGAPWGCDRDGSPQVQGCGWHVAIAHADDMLTVYCHMNKKPRVTTGDHVDTGDTIGVVGTTGNSSGPHLHLEVHKGTTWDSSTAVDPVDFFREKGIGFD